jgi:hypothetical protein
LKFCKETTTNLCDKLYQSIQTVQWPINEWTETSVTKQQKVEWHSEIVMPWYWIAQSRYTLFIICVVGTEPCWWKIHCIYFI